MRRIALTLCLSGALATVPMMALAAPQASSPQSKSSSKPAPKPATHATAGTVKSVDASSLVITKPGAKPSDMTFVLNASTEKKGDLAAGASVQVRYTTSGKQNIATAVTVQKKKS
ncbi:MAG TPA: hypothetical protein VN700_17720 [Vicinamibacterales bacterium]|nr:hypothetical protein [Vicinamibacterales bacterium]